jgi:hypothetical protein
MNTRSAVLVASALVAVAAALHAGPRTSASYNIITDSVDDGGKRAASPAYTSDGSIGGISGVSTVAAPAEIAKSGYIGQLYDVAGLLLNATPLTINESGTLQLAARQLLDDSTFLTVPATSVTWSVISGPLTSINATGLATAGIVYQNTAATAQGTYAGNTSPPLALTVLNVNTDDFPGYLSDGIDDAWQVQYFGLPPNPNAGPNVDFDGTGQTNLFKYIAGLNPLDANSRFTLRIQSIPGQPAQKRLIFAPHLSGRTYTVQSKPSLGSGAFVPLTNPSAPSDNGQERTIADLSAGGPEKFYRVEITKP